MDAYFLAYPAAWVLLLVQFLSVADPLEIHKPHHNHHAKFKSNISQEEYVNVIGQYLERRQNYSYELKGTVPDLLILKSKKNYIPYLLLDMPRDIEDITVESAEIRILLPQIQSNQNWHHIRIVITQIVRFTETFIIHEAPLELSNTKPLWYSFDLTSQLIEQLFRHEPDKQPVMLLVRCVGCSVEIINPLEMAINAMIYREGHRSKRSSYGRHSTDCENITDHKRCCRHDMIVSINELPRLAAGKLIQPKTFDVGLCKGRCLAGFNQASNHSRLQTMLHIKRRKNKGGTSEQHVPKACCAPFKLTHLEVVAEDPNDKTKLTLIIWENMVVLDCACT